MHPAKLASRGLQIGSGSFEDEGPVIEREEACYGEQSKGVEVRFKYHVRDFIEVLSILTNFGGKLASS
jgi:hypothetical protein